MIVTGTLNPSLEPTLAVAQKLRGEVVRAEPTLEDPGGNGVTVTGFRHAGGRGPQALREGVAWATAAVQTPGTGAPPAGLIDLDDVEVSAIE